MYCWQQLSAWLKLTALKAAPGNAFHVKITSNPAHPLNHIADHNQFQSLRNIRKRLLEHFALVYRNLKLEVILNTSQDVEYVLHHVALVATLRLPSPSSMRLMGRI